MTELTLTRYAYPREIDLMVPLDVDFDGTADEVDPAKLRDELDGLDARGSVTCDEALDRHAVLDDVLTICFPFHIDQTEQTFSVIWQVERGGIWEFAGIVYDINGVIVNPLGDDADGFKIVSTPDVAREVCGTYECEAEGDIYLLELEEAPF